jgi:hypothetical protein
MPAADSRCTVRMDRSILSHDAVTCGGSPEVNSTAFDAQPPDLPPVCLVDTGFAVLCQLAPHRRPHHPVLVHRLAPLIHASFRPRLTTTPLRFSSPSPPPGWAGDFHPLAVEHVRHTKENPGSFEPGFSFVQPLPLEDELQRELQDTRVVGCPRAQEVIRVVDVVDATCVSGIPGGSIATYLASPAGFVTIVTG